MSRARFDPGYMQALRGYFLVVAFFFAATFFLRAGFVFCGWLLAGRAAACAAIDDALDILNLSIEVLDRRD
jgi:hypothetical protein